MPGRTFWLLLATLSSTVFVVAGLPTLYWADSAELTAGAYLLGLSHAPSFPLYSLLLKGLLLLPLGGLAYKASVFSGVLAGVGAASAGWLAARGVSRGLAASPAQATAAAGLAAWLFTLTGATWISAARQEVYTLQLVLALGLIGCAVRFSERLDVRWLWLACFLVGLGLGNHSLLMLALLPAGVLYMLAQGRAILLKRHVVFWSGIAFLLGLSVYLYLPVRSEVQPLLDTNNPETWSGFLDSFTKRRETQLFLEREGVLPHLRLLLVAWQEAFSLPVLLLGLLGLRAWRAQRGLGLLLLGLLLGNVGVVVVAPTYRADNPDIPGYLLLSYALLSVLIAMGAVRVWQGLRMWQWLEGPRSEERQKRVAGGGWVLIGLLSLLAVPDRVPKSTDDRAERLAQLYLAQAPQGALLLVKSDAVHFLTFGLQILEGRRPDLTVLNRKGLESESYRAQLTRWDAALFAPARAEAWLDMPSGAGLERLQPQRMADSSEQVEDALRRELPAFLSRRVVLWESGSDNVWLQPLMRPSGLWMEVLARPPLPTEAEQQENLRLLKWLLVAWHRPELGEDPRASQAQEVVLFNLANRLARAPARSLREQRDMWWAVWRVVPSSLPVGIQSIRLLLATGECGVAAQALEVLRGTHPEARLEGLSAETQRCMLVRESSPGDTTTVNPASMEGGR